MTGELQRDAELQRLARVLGVEITALDALDGADAVSLRALTEAIGDHLHEHSKAGFSTAVAVAGRLPAAMAAKLAQHALGPALSAGAAALLEPKQAADLARSVPPAFLAEVAVHADLRRLSPLVAGLNVAMLAEVGEELRQREEWIVLGTFLAHADVTMLPELLAQFDSEALLRAGHFVEDPAKFDGVVKSLPTDRLDDLLSAAAAHDLWPQIIAMSGHVGAQQRKRLAAALKRMPDAVRESRDAVLESDPALRTVAEEAGVAG